MTADVYDGFVGGGASRRRGSASASGGRLVAGVADGPVADDRPVRTRRNGGEEP
ncbi:MULTISPECIES: hypothetical protein [Halorussus]|uniref:hypothetical protein n=1 Tax=Halorussus TaxID=1070314 RepID=UPI0020A066DF|nr:hypothetical protein [Halorussus vallis]USZ75111.1 hypothetical protein NGM07_16960 [Halorussus vallis]